MPSPFPGMNPYIERASVWHDFHKSWIPRAAEMIGAQVLPHYFVRIDGRQYLHELSAEERRFIRHGSIVIPAVDVEFLSFLAIRDRDRHELVTVVELLSPTNKYAGPHRDQYLEKVRQFLRGQIHFVEIDLLRGGPRMPWLDMPACDYCVVVSRFEDRFKERPKAGFWPIRLRDRLPEIPIPLRRGDADARIDLQEVLHRIYDAAGYAYYIYSGPPEPLLSPEDAAWAQQFFPSTPNGN